MRNMFTKTPPKLEVGHSPEKIVEKKKPKNTKKAIIRLWKYMSSQKYLLALALFFVLINTFFSIVAVYMIRPTINGIFEKEGISILLRNLSWLLAMYVISVASNYIQTRIMLEVAQNSLLKLKKDLFFSLQKLPLKYFNAHSTGDIMSRFTNDIDIITQTVSTTFVQLLSGALTIVVTIAIMFYTNWILTLVALTVTPLFSVLTKIVSQKSLKYFKEQQKSIGTLNGFVEERITGQKVLKVFNQEEITIKEFDLLNKDYKIKSFKAEFLSKIMGPVMGILTQMSSVITAIVGGLLCIFMNFDIGGYTVFLGYSRNLNRPINDIFMQINSVFSSLAGAERVFEVMDTRSEKEDEKNAVELKDVKGEIVFQNVHFGYSKNKTVLNDFSLHVKPSQKIAFVGSTGAGKTTISNILNRFYEIHQGKITIDGVPIQSIIKDSLRQNIAVVLQDTHLFNGTIMENIRYGRLDASDEEVINAAKVSNAHSFIKRLECGYETQLVGDGNNLSQGERQLVSIARAAISKAPILMLDEATSYVDTRTEKHIEEALGRIMKKRTTFVIAHRLSTVRNADVIIVLEKGNIIEQGSHTELLKQKGMYYKFYTGAEELD